MLPRYYNLATSVQNNAIQLIALQARTSIVTGMLNDPNRKTAAMVTAAQLVRERQQKQAMLVVRYLYQEWKQLGFFSLAPPVPLTIPEDPQSADLLKIQTTLEQQYDAEIQQQQNPHDLGWLYIVIDVAAEPNTIAAMRANASTSVVLPIPTKNVTVGPDQWQLVADTNYYQMRLYDVNVYLLDAQSKSLGTDTVKVDMTKSGESSFFSCSDKCASSKDMQLHVFSHDEVQYRNYVYDALTTCPVSISDCGDLCPDYIRYSPYGKWNIAHRAQDSNLDLSKLAALRFEFQIDAKFRPDPSINYNQIFGKPLSRYPQGVCSSGTCCIKHMDSANATDSKLGPPVESPLVRVL